MRSSKVVQPKPQRDPVEICLEKIERLAPSDPFHSKEQIDYFYQLSFEI